MPYYIVEEHRNSAGGLKAKEVAPKAATLNRFNTMAVGATHFALSDLSSNSRPVKAPAKKIGYPARFLPVDVIKLKKAYICLITIDAGMRGEV